MCQAWKDQTSSAIHVLVSRKAPNDVPFCYCVLDRWSYTQTNDNTETQVLYSVLGRVKAKPSFITFVPITLIPAVILISLLYSCSCSLSMGIEFHKIGFVHCWLCAGCSWSKNWLLCMFSRRTNLNCKLVYEQKPHSSTLYTRVWSQQSVSSMTFYKKKIIIKWRWLEG